MSPSDPHAPTPAGPDPDEKTAVHSAADPFAPGSDAAREAADRAASDTPEGAIGGTPEGPAGAEPTPTVPPSDATAESPAGSVKPASEWLAERDQPGPADTAAAHQGAPAPEVPFPTPDPTAPPGTPESDPGAAESLTAQAQALTEKPEAMVGLAFVGGAALSLILKRFGR